MINIKFLLSSHAHFQSILSINPLKEVKMYSEMIMGSVAVAYHPNNMKLHFLGKNKYNIDTQPLVSML